MAEPTMDAAIVVATPQETSPLVPRAGMMALAEMGDDEFAARLKLLVRGRDRMQQIKREMMQDGVHFGIVPGTPKPTLLKPGAEVLCEIYGLRARFIPEIILGDGVTAPAIRVVTKCLLHLGTLEGPAIAEGYGASNSWERKHRYRTAERACPECGVIGALLKSKNPGEGFFCWAKRGGCGAKFEPNDKRVTEQQLGQIDNPDPHDLENTLVKMSAKRALMDVTLRATHSSDLFTQDMEDVAPSDALPPQDGKSKAATTKATEPRNGEERKAVAGELWTRLQAEFGVGNPFLKEGDPAATVPLLVVARYKQMVLKDTFGATTHAEILKMPDAAFLKAMADGLENAIDVAKKAKLDHDEAMEQVT